MAEPTLVEIFGSGASQDENSVTISKSALTGLTASANNRAESILIAILLKAQSYLSQTKFDADTDVSVYFSSGFTSFTNRNNTQYRVDQLIINLAKLDTQTSINPMDY